MKPRLLDLFCGAGGAAMGYAPRGRGMTCPNCASTDIADRTDGKRECLDCSFVWVPGGRRKARPPYEAWERGRTPMTYADESCTRCGGHGHIHPNLRDDESEVCPQCFGGGSQDVDALDALAHILRVVLLPPNAVSSEDVHREATE